MIIKNKDIKSINKRNTYIKRFDINSLKSGTYKISKIKQNKGVTND